MNPTTEDRRDEGCAPMTGSACRACGSTAESYFSRIEPMGYHCPDCGHPEGDDVVPEKPNHGIVGHWVSVADEMPDDEITVLVWVATGAGDVTLAHHDSDVLDRRGDSGWIMAGSTRVLRAVTHWCRDVLPPCQPNDSGQQPAQ